MILHDLSGEPVLIHPLEVEAVGGSDRAGVGAEVAWLPRGARKAVLLRSREPVGLVLGLLGRRGIEVKVLDTYQGEKRDANEYAG